MTKMLLLFVISFHHHPIYLREFNVLVENKTGCMSIGQIVKTRLINENQDVKQVYFYCSPYQKR